MVWAMWDAPAQDRPIPIAGSGFTSVRRNRPPATGGRLSGDVDDDPAIREGNILIVRDTNEANACCGVISRMIVQGEACAADRASESTAPLRVIRCNSREPYHVPELSSYAYQQSRHSVLVFG